MKVKAEILYRAHRAYALAVIWGASLCGCNQPTFSASIPQGAGKPPIVVNQSGEAAKSATVTIKKGGSANPLEWFSRLTGKPIQKTGFSEYREPSIGEETITISGPEAFAPPVPPTPGQKAIGGVVITCGVALVIAFSGAGLLAYLGHMKAAGVAALTGCVMGAAAKFLTLEWFWIIAGVGGLLSGTIWACWHFVKNRVPEEFGGKLKIKVDGRK